MKKILLILLPIFFVFLFLATPKSAKAYGNMGGVLVHVQNSVGTAIPNATVTVSGNPNANPPGYDYNFLDGSHYRYNSCSDAAFVYDTGDNLIYIRNALSGTTNGVGDVRIAPGYAGTWSQRNNWGLSCACNNFTVIASAPGYYSNSQPAGLANTDNGFTIALISVPPPPAPTCNDISVRKGSSTGPTLTEGEEIPMGTQTCVGWHTNNVANTYLETFKNGVSMGAAPPAGLTSTSDDWTYCSNLGAATPTVMSTWKRKITTGSSSCTSVTYKMVPAASVSNSCPTLTASPTSVRQGDPVKLSWTSGQNVKKIDIKQKPPGASSTLASIFYSPTQISAGSLEVVPSVSTTYILDAEYLSGSPTTCTTLDVPVTVRPSQSGSEGPVPPN